MSLLDKASLVVTPNAYKTSKLYSVVPNTTLGDMDVVRATTATRVNSAGLIESVAVNVPRIDYTNGSCPSLLVEPQRTNLLQRSEEFDNAIWAKINSTIGANSAISPSGNLNADSLIDNSTNSIHVCGNDGGGAGLYTFSFYAKANTLTRVGLLTGATVNVTLASTAQVFDLSNGTVVNTISGVTASISPLINGWYRCSVTLTALASGTYFITCIKSGTNIAYIGSGERLFIWGAQLEVGSYPTSYIPTVASTVTRNADVISKTGISSLIGQTEGTMFWDINVDIISATNSENILNIDNGGFGTTMYLIKTAVGTLGGELYNGGVVQFSSTTPITQKGRYKCALAYKTNDFALYINGIQIGTDSSGTIGAMSRLQLGQGVLGASVGNTNSVVLWKERLSNEQLTLLTGDLYDSYAEMANSLNYILE
jgi:hypothetical protein